MNGCGSLFKKNYVMEPQNEKLPDGRTKRTTQQNRALHKSYELIANELNGMGLDMRKVLKPNVEIPFTSHAVKEYLFKPIIKALYGYTSTTQLEKLEEVDHAYEVMMRYLMQNHGMPYVEFPNDPERISNYAGVENSLGAMGSQE